MNMQEQKLQITLWNEKGSVGTTDIVQLKISSREFHRKENYLFSWKYTTLMNFK